MADYAMVIRDIPYWTIGVKKEMIESDDSKIAYLCWNGAVGSSGLLAWPTMGGAEESSKKKYRPHIRLFEAQARAD